MEPTLSIEPARPRSAARSAIGAVLLSCLGGKAWGILAGEEWAAHAAIQAWLHPHSAGHDDLLRIQSIALISAYVGGLIGACCGVFVSPLVVAALWRRDPRKAIRRIVLPVSGAVVLLTLADIARGASPPPLGWSVLIPAGPVAFFVLYTFWVGRRLPPMQPEGCCAGCGYDVRASREFGRCPECGCSI